MIYNWEHFLLIQPQLYIPSMLTFKQEQGKNDLITATRLFSNNSHLKATLKL